MWSNNCEVLRDAAIEGGGIVLIPRFLVSEALQSGTLLEVLPEFKTRQAMLCAIYPRNRHLSRKVQLFVQYALEKIGSVPGWTVEQST